MDLKSGTIVSAVLHTCGSGRHEHAVPTLDDAQAKPGVVKAADKPDTVHCFDLVVDKGYHSGRF